MACNKMGWLTAKLPITVKYLLSSMYTGTLFSHLYLNVNKVQNSCLQRWTLFNERLEWRGLGLGKERVKEIGKPRPSRGAL